MALPGSGQLSFSAIATELGAGTPYSLRSMSDFVSFSTPDAVSDFYGYNATITYTYLNNYAAGDPCYYDYWDIYLGSDGVYYRFDGTYYDPMYNYTNYWYEYLYYEPLFPADIYQEWEINPASTVLTNNGNVAINCF
jgi:hypothetical protein